MQNSIWSYFIVLEEPFSFQIDFKQIGVCRGRLCFITQLYSHAGFSLMRMEIKSSPIKWKPPPPKPGVLPKGTAMTCWCHSSICLRVCHVSLYNSHTLSHGSRHHLTQASHIQAVCAGRCLITRTTLDHGTTWKPVPKLRIDVHQLFTSNQCSIQKKHTQ